MVDGVAIIIGEARAGIADIVRAGDDFDIAVIREDQRMNARHVLDELLAIAEAAKTEQAQEMMPAKPDYLFQ